MNQNNLIASIDDIHILADSLDETMNNIMDKKSNTLKYRHWRIRNVWKDFFIHNSFEDEYTANIYYMFKTAISYHIESMSEDETNHYLKTVLKMMKEI